MQFPSRFRHLALGVCTILLVVGIAFWFVRNTDRGSGPLPPPAAGRLLADAEAALERNDSASAKNLLKACLDQVPTHPLAGLYYGQILRDEGQTDLALQQWQRIQQGTGQELATARFLEGTVAIERGRVDLSYQLLKESLRWNPAYLDAHERLVNICRMLRRPQELTEHLNAIAAQRPLTFDELIYHTIPADSGFPGEESTQILRACLAESPDDARCLMAYVSILRESRQSADALRTLEASQLTADSPDLTAEKILALVELDRLPEAEALRQQWLKNGISHRHLDFACGKVTFLLERWQEAAYLFSRVLKDDPNHSEACYLLGLSQARLGHKEASAGLLNRSVKLDDVQRFCLRLSSGDRAQAPQVEAIVLELASSLDELQRYAEAANWYAVALQMTPGNSATRSRWEQSQQAALRALEQPVINPAWLHVNAVDFAALPLDRGAHPAPEPNSLQQTARFQFRDVHEQADLNFQYFNGKTEFHHLIESMGGGVIVIDYDGDHWPDLYFPQGCLLTEREAESGPSNCLFRNLGNGHFRDVTAAAGVGSKRYSLGGTAFDFDNDGDDDLLVSNFGRCELFQNNGDGTFSEISEQLGLSAAEMTTSVAAADFNNDGHLDLYLVNYVEGLKVCRSADGSYATCDPANFEGQPDRLLMNDGHGGFRDLSDSAGIRLPLSKGLGVVAVDFNRDGWMDLYVANDGVPNFLFKNVTSPDHPDQIRFEECGLISGAGLDGAGRAQAGMGIAVSDFDQNGWPDLYVTNFYQEANTLYLNSGDMQFSDATKPAGLYGATLPLLGFGSVARDFDADGDADLIVANGHIYRDSTGEQPWKMRPQLFENLGGGRFAEIRETAGPFWEHASLGRGVAVLDWNRDRRPDVVMVHQDRPVALLQNDSSQESEMLVIRLTGTLSNRNAIGARVKLSSAAGTSEQTVQADGGYLACHTRDLFFSLQSFSATADIQIKVEWPSGITSEHQVLPTASQSLWSLAENGQSVSISNSD